MNCSDSAYINQLKFYRLSEKVREDFSIWLFISSPFDSAEDERKYFMNKSLPMLISLSSTKGITLSVVDMRYADFTYQLSSLICFAMLNCIYFMQIWYNQSDVPGE